MIKPFMFDCLCDEVQANEFIDKTGIDALAVCIGNVHGKYPASGPNLKLDLLKVKQIFPSCFSVITFVIWRLSVLLVKLFCANA